MIEFIGWTLLSTIVYLFLKKIFIKKKKYFSDEIILDGNTFDHYGPFSGSFKHKKRTENR